MKSIAEEFKRENRYVVFKRTDAEKYLTDEQQITMHMLLTKINVGRLRDDRRVDHFVCVADDWPEFDVVWEMIEARMTGKPDELTRLRAENAGLQKRVERLGEQGLNLAALVEAMRKALDGLMIEESRGRIMPIGKAWDAARAAHVGAAPNALRQHDAEVLRRARDSFDPKCDGYAWNLLNAIIESMADEIEGETK